MSVPVQRLERVQVVRRPLHEVFAFFSEAQNLERITPPWLRFGLRTPVPIDMSTGTRIEYRLRLHGIPLRWVSVIESWEEERGFIDRQVSGPFRLWRHQHEFSEVEGGTSVQDRVDYALPFGRLGRLLGIPIVRRDLERIFDYRRAAVAGLLG
jgi:ligand-binding SRPBCC domain-containing protein